METIHLPHLADHPLRLCLFHDVTNASFLRQQLLAGNKDFEYAFLDASVLLSRDHVLAACWRAVNDMQQHRLRSKNVHSEIVFSLSPNNNIAESFRRFGVQDETKLLLAIKVGGDMSAVEAHLRQTVHGTPIPFNNEALERNCDYARVRKVYKTEPLKKGEDEDHWRCEAESYVIGSMALRGS